MTGAAYLTAFKNMASAWSDLDSSVTLLAQADGLLPRMDAFAGDLAGRALAEAGADVRSGVTVIVARRPARRAPATSHCPREPPLGRSGPSSR
jgi:dihydrolipoamide dehydrogenase